MSLCLCANFFRDSVSVALSRRLKRGFVSTYVSAMEYGNCAWTLSVLSDPAKLASLPTLETPNDRKHRLKSHSDNSLAGVAPDCIAYSYADPPLRQSGWDEEAWLNAWQNCGGDPHIRRQLNLLVTFNTIAVCRSVAASTDRPEEFSLAEGRPRKHGESSTRVKPGEDLPSPCEGRETELSVECIDSLDIALALATQGFDPLVLNMANAKYPGGGYRYGAIAQEECLFRRTDYHRTVDRDLSQQLSGGPGVVSSSVRAGRKFGFYPHEKFGAIWSRQVVIREGEADGYRLRAEPVQLGFVAIAAEKLHRERELTMDDMAIFFKKIVLLLEVAVRKGHDSLVLGALGCGAFNNPPVSVAAAFLAALSCYTGYFKKIVFAILDNHAGRTISAFQEILLGPLAGRARGGAGTWTLAGPWAGSEPREFLRLFFEDWSHGDRLWSSHVVKKSAVRVEIGSTVTTEAKLSQATRLLAEGEHDDAHQSELVEVELPEMAEDSMACGVRPCNVACGWLWRR